MMGTVVYYQLVGLRNFCIAMAKSIDMILEEIEAQGAVPRDGKPGDQLAGDTRCQHPVARRIPIPAMGRKRFKCMDCNEDVYEDTGETVSRPNHQPAQSGGRPEGGETWGGSEIKP